MNNDIVLICLDSVRKDTFDEVATRTQKLSDVSFDNCRAASSWSPPSHASMISGLLPHEHRVTTHSRSFNSLSRESTIFDDLYEYRTIGISGNVFAGPSFQFDRYFDDFWELKCENRFPKALYPSGDKYDKSIRNSFRYIFDSIRNERTLKSVLNGITGFLGSVTDDSLSRIFDRGAKPGLRIAQEELQKDDTESFIFVNLMEGHIPYRPTRYLDTDFYADVPKKWCSGKKSTWELIRQEYDEQYWNRRNQLYEATIDYLDRCISEFVESINSETIVIVTADHGDNLGTETDEGLANHKSSLSEGLLHVPLYIINAPDMDNQTGQYFSHLKLPELINGCKSGYIPDIKTDCTFAELGGLSSGQDPGKQYEYYNRAIRCGYDKSDKITWDSFGNCSKYHVEPDKLNHQKHISEVEHPPSWATDNFRKDILTFKNELNESQEKVTVDDSTSKRLEDLGYM